MRPFVQGRFNVRTALVNLSSTLFLARGTLIKRQKLVYKEFKPDCDLYRLICATNVYGID